MILSVIIPFFNADYCIGRMLKSLLKQDLSKEEYEIIIIDDGSSEESINLMRFVNENSNVFYYRQDNSGPGAARNKGLEMAKGEYVMFCDSDDFVADNVLGRLCRIAAERNLDMLFYNVPRVTAKEIRPIPRNNFDHVAEFSTGRAFFSQPIVGSITTGVWQFILNRSLIDRKKLRFPSNMIMNEDSCFFLDAILSAGKTGKVEVDAYYYVQNTKSLIHAASKTKFPVEFANNMLSFVKKLTVVLEDETRNKSVDFINNIKWLRNQKAYIMLYRSCRTLSPSEFEKCIYELIRCNSYPHPFGKNRLIQRVFLKPPIIRFINRLISFLH